MVTGNSFIVHVVMEGDLRQGNTFSTSGIRAHFGIFQRLFMIKGELFELAKFRHLRFNSPRCLEPLTSGCCQVPWISELPQVRGAGFWALNNI